MLLAMKRQDLCKKCSKTCKIEIEDLGYILAKCSGFKPKTWRCS